MKEKVLFVQKIDEGEFETESLWCTKTGEGFVIDNIPFVARRIALGDIIKAEFDLDEKAYYFEDFVSVSGNSTVRIFLEDIALIPSIREAISKFNCESEIFLDRKIIAVNIPKNVNYAPVKVYLEEGEGIGLWQYEESCLAHSY